MYIYIYIHIDIYITVSVLIFRGLRPPPRPPYHRVSKLVQKNHQQWRGDRLVTGGEGHYEDDHDEDYYYFEKSLK